MIEYTPQLCPWDTPVQYILHIVSNTVNFKSVPHIHFTQTTTSDYKKYFARIQFSLFILISKWFGKIRYFELQAVTTTHTHFVLYGDQLAHTIYI